MRAPSGNCFTGWFLMEEHSTTVDAVMTKSISQRLRGCMGSCADWSQCGSVQVDLRANTMNLPKAATSDEVKVQFYVNNAWTKAMDFVPSAEPGESVGRVFNLEAFPTQARLVAMNPDQDTWGFTKLWIQDTCEIVLVEDKYGEWIGNKAAPERTYPISECTLVPSSRVMEPCKLGLSWNLWLPIALVSRAFSCI